MLIEPSHFYFKSIAYYLMLVLIKHPKLRTSKDLSLKRVGVLETFSSSLHFPKINGRSNDFLNIKLMIKARLPFACFCGPSAQVLGEAENSRKG